MNSLRLAETLAFLGTQIFRNFLVASTVSSIMVLFYFILFFGGKWFST